MNDTHYVIIHTRVIEYEETFDIIGVVHTEAEAESFIKNYVNENNINEKDLYYIEV